MSVCVGGHSGELGVTSPDGVENGVEEDGWMHAEGEVVDVAAAKEVAECDPVKPRKEKQVVGVVDERWTDLGMSDVPGEGSLGVEKKVEEQEEIVDGVRKMVWEVVSDGAVRSSSSSKEPGGVGRMLWDRGRREWGVVVEEPDADEGDEYQVCGQSRVKWCSGRGESMYGDGFHVEKVEVATGMVTRNQVEALRKLKWRRWWWDRGKECPWFMPVRLEQLKPPWWMKLKKEQPVLVKR